LFALAQARPDNVEAALERLRVLAGTPFDDLVSLQATRAALLSGHAGLAFDAAAPDPLVLARTLRFAVKRHDDLLAFVTVPQLASVQRSDGGFGFADSDSDLSLTAEIAWALTKTTVPEAASVRARAVAWLQARLVNRGQLCDADLALLILGLGADLPAAGDALSAELLARQGVDGTFDGGDVRATALGALALRAVLPDLLFAGTPGILPQPIVGSEYSFQISVTNAGRATAEATRLSARVLDETGHQIGLASSDVPSLQPGRSAVVAVNLGTQTGTGTRTVLLSLNDPPVFPEATYDNNTTALKLQVTTQPDLVVESSDISAVPSVPALWQTTGLTVRVRNVGGATARDVHVLVTATGASLGTVILADTFLNAVAPGTPRAVRAQYTPRSLEPVTVLVQVDPENAIHESDETNNQASVQLTAVTPGEILTDASAIIWGPATVTQGNPISLHWAAQLIASRYGTYYWETSRWPYQDAIGVLTMVGPSGSRELARKSFHLYEFGSSGADTLALDTSGWPEGVYQFTVVADPDGLIKETTRANNVQSTSVTIATANLPELWTENLRTEPALVAPGASYHLKGTIRNTGLQAATNIPVRVNGPGGQVDFVVPSLAPGETYPVDMAFVAGGVGNYQLQLRIDPAVTIAEGSWQNNLALANLTVAGGDLQIVSVTTTPAPIQANKPAVAHIDVLNIGTQTGVEIFAHLQTSDLGKPIGDGHFTGYPAPGKHAVIDVPLDTTKLLGQQQALLVVTPSGVAYASWLSPQVILPTINPDFAVSARSIQLSPEGAAPGSSVTPTITVNNLGDLGAVASVHLYLGYPEQGMLAASGSIRVEGRSSAQVQLAPFQIPGSPVDALTVVIDEESAYLEVDKTNNVAARPMAKAPGTIVVAFDETHAPSVTLSLARASGDEYNGAFADFAKDLEARGYTVRAITASDEGLTAGRLSGVDVLIEPTSEQLLDVTGLATLKTYLSESHGFLMIGEWGDPNSPLPWQAAEDQIAGVLGISNPAGIYGGSPGVQCSGAWGTFLTNPHPITTGITAIMGAATGGLANLPPQAVVLAQTTAPQLMPNTAVAAAWTQGAARIAAVGDSQFFDGHVQYASYLCGSADVYETDWRFDLQLIDWLVQAGPPDTAPDLAFVPSTITLDSALVVSGDQVGASVNVRNVGASAVGPGATVRLYQGSAASGVLIGEQPLGPLASEADQPLSFTWDTTHAAGPQVLTAVIDPGPTISEYTIDNNTITLGVVVAPANELRVDPSDIVLVGGQVPSLSVRVHNTGVRDTPAGVELLVTDEAGGAPSPIATVTLPLVPALGAVTMVIPWLDLDREAGHTVVVTLDRRQYIADSNTMDNQARAEILPPTLLPIAPADATIWGGVKDVLWSARSAEVGILTSRVALAPEGGAFTELSAQVDQRFALDTTAWADGPYRLRLTASDGALETRAEIPFIIDNAHLAIRRFSGGATALLGPGLAHDAIRMPVGVRVDSATLAVEPVQANSLIDPNPTNSQAAGLVAWQDRLYYFDTQPQLAAVFGYRSSADGGATWSPRTALSPAGLTLRNVRAFVNQRGLHAFYQDNYLGTIFYTQSADGTTWAAPTVLGTGGGDVTYSVTDFGLTALAPGGYGPMLAYADPVGRTWSTFAAIAGLPKANRTWRALIAGGYLHVFALTSSWQDGGITYYRTPSGSDYGNGAAFEGPARLSTGIPYDATPLWFEGAIHLAFMEQDSSGLRVKLERCGAVNRCSADGWLPEPILLGGAASSPSFGAGATGSAGVLWTWGDVQYTTNAIQGGARWQPTWNTGLPYAAYPSLLWSSDGVALAGPKNFQTVFERRPGLTPTDLAISLGGASGAFLARPGMQAQPGQSADLAADLNAYLAAHADGDDGIIDGFIDVPLIAMSGGTGQTVLSNLEVRYRPLSEVDGFAEPSLFSPGASPGVQDTTTLSVLNPSPIAVTSVDGAVVRVLDSTSAAGRFAAVFDGFDGQGSVLPSGVYLFGPGGQDVGQVEIDDIPPIARLDVDSDGSLVGAAAIRGIASDADYAGTTKNFGRYVLQYSLDGVTYQPITTGTSPTTGVLAYWNVGAVHADTATLRLTVTDRAGNSTVVQRPVRLSPNAPRAPVITAPTTASTPVDALSSTITVGGTCEAGSTVTLQVLGVAAGSATCDGRWTIPGVVLPAGVSSITASATRNGTLGVRSEPILVAKYALELTLEPHGLVGTGSDGAVLVHLSRVSVHADPLHVSLTSRDSAGHSGVLRLTPAAVDVALAGVGSTSFSVNVSESGLPPGSYRVATDVTSGGLLPAHAETSMTVAGSTMVSAILASDRAVYDALEAVALTIQVADGGAIGTGPLTGILQIVDPTGLPQTLAPISLGSVAAGGTQQATVLYGLPPLAVGVYLADVTVVDEAGALVAVAQTSFEVQPANGVGELAGSLLVTPAVYLKGDQLTAQFSVTNLGDTSDVPVTLLLIEQASSAIVFRQDLALSIPVGAASAGQAALGTQAADGAELIAVLVGRGRALAGQSVLPLPWRDTTPPVIVLSGFTDGEYRAGPVTPVITITDDSPVVSTIQLNGANFASGATVSSDGAYHLAVHATDVWGNASEAAASFTIDTTPPSLAVTGVTAGSLVNVAVTPAVTVTDVNLRSTTILLDGAPFVPGIVVGAEGDHLLSVTADDLAGNTAHDDVPFTIDQTPPLIVIQGVTDGALVNVGVFLTVDVSDAHPGTSVILLDGADWDGLPVLAGGDHVLSVHAVDLAGNPADAAVHFIIDRTPPTITVAGVQEGQLYGKAVMPLVSATDLHGATWTATLDAAAWSGATVATDGAHTLTVHAADGAGNPSYAAVHFTIDLTPPTITVSGVQDGQLYNKAVTPVVTATDAHPGTTTITLDSQPWTSGSPVAAEGDHVLSVTAVDAVGNRSLPTDVHFTIDLTPPTITVSGVTDGATYTGAATFTFSAQDAHLTGVAGTLDGATATSPTTVSAAGTHVLVATASDAAGNQATSRVTFTIQVQNAVTATLIARLARSGHVLVALPCSGGGGACTCDQATAALLLNTLRQASIPYEVACGASQLTSGMRTGRYQTFVLYLDASPEQPARRELRELVWAGRGLIVVNDSPPDQDPTLTPALGATVFGTIGSLGTVTVLPGDLGPTTTFAFSGRGVRQETGTAGAAATTSRGDVVASVNRYGAGRSVLLTFDTEAGPATAMSDLLLRTLAFAGGGTTLAPVIGQPLDVELAATLASGGPATLRLQADVPPGLTVVAAQGASTLTPPTWIFSLPPGQSQSSWLTVSPARAGTFTLDSSLWLNGGSALLLAAASIDVGPVASADALLQAAITAAKGLGGQSKQDQSRRDKVVAGLTAIQLPIRSASAGAVAISHVLDAIDDLATVASPPATLHHELDQLLVALEVATSAATSP
jgi:subtilase family serine protease